MKKIKFGRMEDNLKFFYPMNKTEKESLGYIKKGGWGDRTFENTIRPGQTIAQQSTFFFLSLKL